MKLALTVFVTLIYSAGWFATYSADRELGRAKCFKTERYNEWPSSVTVATLWPIYTVLGGVMLTMVMGPGDSLCNHNTAQR